MKFKDMDLMMLKEYKYDARKHKLKGIMDILRLGTFMYYRDLTSMTEWLSKIVNYLDDLDPKFPRYYRSEANKIEFLLKS